MKYFSAIELRDIILSMIVLSVAFSYPEFMDNPAALLVYMAIVGIAFIGHELSHKFTAIKQGFWSEYRMWPQGLVLALLLAFASGGRFLFAAPGAVYFDSGGSLRRPTKKHLKRIAVAGVSFNIALMWVSLALFLLAGSGLFIAMATINGWLAIFNLLPIGMLDGDKLLRLDRKLWALVFVLAVGGFIASQALPFFLKL